MSCLAKRLGRGSVAAALVLTLAGSGAGTVRAADHPAASDGDNQLEMKAREAFAASRYDEAIDSFAKLYAKTLNPIYLRNIGRCFQQKREPDAAIDKFRDYLAKTKTGKYKTSTDERAEIDGYIKEMEALRDEQAKAAAPVQPLPAPAPAAAPPPALPPPTGMSTAPAATLVAQPVPAESESHPIYTRWWFWTIVGVVLIGGTVAAVAASSGGTSKPSCPSGAMCR
jgi:hypothetical protein